MLINQIKQKKYMIFHYWYFKNVDGKFEPYVMAVMIY